MKKREDGDGEGGKVRKGEDENDDRWCEEEERRRKERKQSERRGGEEVRRDKQRRAEGRSGVKERVQHLFLNERQSDRQLFSPMALFHLDHWSHFKTRTHTHTHRHAHTLSGAAKCSLHIFKVALLKLLTS